MIQFFIYSVFSSCFFLKLFQIFALGSYGVTTSDLIVILLFVYMIYKHIWLNEPLFFVNNKIFIWVGLLVLCSLLSSINPLLSTDRVHITQYIKTTLHFLYIILFCSYFAFLIIDLKIWKNFLKFIMIAGVFLNVFAIYQMFARIYSLPFAWIKINNISMLDRNSQQGNVELDQLALNFENFFRATSIFSEPSALASYNLYVLVFLIVPFFIGSEQLFKSKYINFMILILTIIGTFLTFSLTATTGVLIIIICIILFEKVKIKKLVKFVSAIIFSLAFLLIFDNVIYKYTNIKVADLFYQRISSTIFKSKEVDTIVGESFNERSASIYDGFEIWKNNPIIGIGLGNTYLNKTKEMSFSIYSSFAVLIEMGIIGLILYLGIFSSLIYNTFELRRLNLKLEYNNKVYNFVSLGNICFYIIILQIFFNFVTSNLVVSEASWLIIMFFVSITNNIQIKNGYKVFEVSIFKISLKKKLYIYLKENNLLKLSK